MDANESISGHGPEAVIHIPRLLKSLGDTVVIAGATAVVAMALLPALPGRTCGATRSSRIRWQQRRAEIDKVVAQAEAESRAGTVQRPDGQDGESIE